MCTPIGARHRWVCEIKHGILHRLCSVLLAHRRHTHPLTKRGRRAKRRTPLSPCTRRVWIKTIDTVYGLLLLLLLILQYTPWYIYIERGRQGGWRAAATQEQQEKGEGGYNRRITHRDTTVSNKQTSWSRYTNRASLLVPPSPPLLLGVYHYYYGRRRVVSSYDS